MKTTKQNACEALAKTLYDLATSPGTEYAYMVVCDGAESGWTLDFASWRANPSTRLIVQRTLTGRRRGSEWTVYCPAVSGRRR